MVTVMRNSKRFTPSKRTKEDRTIAKRNGFRRFDDEISWQQLREESMEVFTQRKDGGKNA